MRKDSHTFENARELLHSRTYYISSLNIPVIPYGLQAEQLVLQCPLPIPFQIVHACLQGRCRSIIHDNEVRFPAFPETTDFIVQAKCLGGSQCTFI